VSKIQRLPHSDITRQKIAASLTGQTKSEETKAKIAASIKGRKHSPEAIEKMRAAARARFRPKTVEDVIMLGRLDTKARYARISRESLLQWKKDLRAAYDSGNEALYADVRRSLGYAYGRRIKGWPGVSDGFISPRNRGEMGKWYRWIRTLEKNGLSEIDLPDLDELRKPL